MDKVTKYYETIGDTLRGKQAERAYRAAQNALCPVDSEYMPALKRIQQKIIVAIDQYTLAELANDGMRHASGFYPSEVSK